MSSQRSPVPPAGSHGGDGVAVALALGLDPRDLVDLSQNMNPFAPSVDPLVLRHLDAVGRYPDPRQATLVLAETLDVAPECLLVTNGGSEAIHVLTAVLGGRVREPEFGLHPRGGSGPLWRTDPHSPTGRLAGADEVADVWDEAFYALATGRWTAGRAGVVVGSLTKTFHCPGLRLGYVIADPEVVRACAQQQAHWSVSTLALSLVPDLLETADLPSWSRSIRDARTDLVAVLESHGLSVEAADAPWVLIHEPGLREQLAPQGVLVRDCASFGLAGVARMAVPDSDGLQIVERALSRR
ncbi:aminotransferase class I/II-fold pyridoxal phosphate-dependent enzyme [Ornithinimicrobium sp. F0845]|uniref:aminotransferase class I/II-fold pyridoxal phosphate-dependent enzyme n=1 Tax=Ornithinimicrobium sp. F0845 TaxID=2926412 RepID=UPI001FF6E68C|nr:aminotransferase class I/II-fold pyridoxal phosphate-dependent enzyme [Ornithinimicrobium sp. F0845]MCK0112528.1 aminotransferase class I/II-fold pyridoxal phosphate-dependent enzyme [Ornithinimicrobium sp. F0845]